MIKLSWDYIKQETIWVIKFIDRPRITVKGSELDAYLNNYNDSIRDHDIITWRGQPKDLQEFYKAYEYAYYTLDRRDLFYLEDFYKEWIKNPDQFKAEHRKPISTLWTELDNLVALKNDKLNIIVINYDKQTAGNHYLKNWLNTKRIIETDFDVVEIKNDRDTYTFIIQTDDNELFDKLGEISNRIAIQDD